MYMRIIAVSVHQTWVRVRVRVRVRVSLTPTPTLTLTLTLSLALTLTLTLTWKKTRKLSQSIRFHMSLKYSAGPDLNSSIPSRATKKPHIISAMFMKVFM